MSSLRSFCKICGGYLYISFKHKCPPEYEVRHEEYLGENNLKIVHAVDIENAAVKYGEDYDHNSDSYLCTGETVVIEVRKKGMIVFRKFEVSADLVAEYYANELEGE